MKIVVHRGLVHHIALTEEVHDLRVLAVETVLQLIQLAHRLVVQITLAVTLDHGHTELVHRIIGTEFPAHGVTLQVIHQTLGGEVGTLVETLHLVTPHFQLHVTVHDGETRLVILAKLPIVTHQVTLGIIDAGNAGMASGGMGDVLSGIIGALLGQKMSPYDAACAGCVAHGAAADVLAARFGTRGMLATDLFSTLQRIVNPEVTDKNHDESSNSAP